MKKYKILWNEPTDIADKLSREAKYAFAVTDPLEIREYKSSIGYRYAINGAIVMFNLTAEDVNDIGEELYEQIVAARQQNEVE